MPIIGDHVAERMPDYIEPLVGVRGWYTRDDQLLSTWSQHTWDTVEHARCRPQISPSGEVAHDAPAESCSCGLYAFHSPESLEQHYPGIPIVGIVQMWGTCEVHADGVRAEWMRICALSVQPFWRMVEPTLQLIGAFAAVVTGVIGVAILSLAIILSLFSSTSFWTVIIAGFIMLGCVMLPTISIGLVAFVCSQWGRYKRLCESCARIRARHQVPEIHYNDILAAMDTYGQRVHNETSEISNSTDQGDDKV